VDGYRSGIDLLWGVYPRGGGGVKIFDSADVELRKNPSNTDLKPKGRSLGKGT